MQLEDQVCNLEYAKRLSELGVKQESLFCWQGLKGAGTNDEPIFRVAYITQKYCSDTYKSYNAYTAAELGDLIFNLCTEITTEMLDEYDGIYYRITNNKTEDIVDHISEANARAQCLINLIANKLIELPS